MKHVSQARIVGKYRHRLLFVAFGTPQILAEELRIRGGTKHYSNLAVKLGIAEAEIRSVNARKMQLAVKLGQVEREKQQALQVSQKAVPSPKLSLPQPKSLMFCNKALHSV